MENIMHPKGGVDIRQLFDKFPHIIKLALSIDKAEEIASHSFFFPHGQMGLYQAAEGAVQPFRIDQRTVEPAQELNVLSGMGIILSLIHISEPTRQAEISYAVFCLKKIFF